MPWPLIGAIGIGLLILITILASIWAARSIVKRGGDQINDY